MKSFLLTLILFTGFATGGFAQSKDDGGKFSIGFDLGLPIGTQTSKAYAVGFGGSLKYDMPLSSATAFTLSAGYTSFKNKSAPIGASGPAGSVGFIPVKAGVKYYLASSFYGEAQAGAVFATKTGGGSSTAFAYAPGIGYNFGCVDFGVRYEGWAYSGATISQVALRLAYVF